MKTLNAYVVYNENTDINILKGAASTFADIHFTYENEVEKIIDASNAHSFDMLIIDKTMDSEEIKKINKVIDLIYPEVATVEMLLTDVDFIHFKLNSMLAKWEEANTETSFNFIDNPAL